MARTLKQIREQNALRAATFRERKRDKSCQQVCVWVSSAEKAKAIRALADNPEAK